MAIKGLRQVLLSHPTDSLINQFSQLDQNKQLAIVQDLSRFFIAASCPVVYEQAAPYRCQQKSKSVILLSTQHHSKSIDRNTGKPNIILSYNETKSGFTCTHLNLIVTAQGFAISVLVS